jgi:hypothetical protein
MGRISIRRLMAFVIVSAIGLAALRNANELWAGLMLLIALAAVGIAVLGAVLMRDKERAWWLGFAVFAVGYLALSVGPFPSPQLGTSQFLISMHPIVTASEAPLPPILWRQRAHALAQVERLKAAGQGPADPMLKSAMQVLTNLDTQLAGTPSQVEFIRVGHALFALLAGLVGGTVALWFRARRERAETG